MSSVKFQIAFFLTFLFISNLPAQELKVKVSANVKYQTMEGFGAALAFYENWLTAHPNKDEIYEAIFNELSLDILRVRNAYDYDAGMVGRVKEFIDASEKKQGRPIPFLSTSWGPPPYLKSNNDRSNGGTLIYTITNGKVEFDYDGFANWWDKSLTEYKSKGLYPTYISIQNEPDYKATWESCLLNPFEKVNSTDTLAGYNKALEAVYSKLSNRPEQPKIIGPECIGIGYNSLKNYLTYADTSLLYGIAHHLYHGVDVNNPWTNTTMKAIGQLYPNMKYFQSEYSGNDWFNLAGLIYKSLADENVCAYFYWDLIWDNGGLVSLDNPWNRGSWKTTKGYQKTKLFYAFKQFSSFIHPEWQRIDVAIASSEVKAVGFISPGQDSISIAVINLSKTGEKVIRFDIPDFNYLQSALYVTSDDLNCQHEGNLDEPVFSVQPRSINTAFFTKSTKSSIFDINTVSKIIPEIYPNPFNDFIYIKTGESDVSWMLYSIDGSLIKSGKSSKIDCRELDHTMFVLKVNNSRFKIIKK